MIEDGGGVVKPDAVARAEKLGHIPEWDPPAGMTAAQRWTCSECSATVLDYCGNVYGSAVENQCEPLS